MDGEDGEDGERGEEKEGAVILSEAKDLSVVV
jgi:hypothetical protein